MDTFIIVIIIIILIILASMFFTHNKSEGFAGTGALLQLEASKPQLLYLSDDPLIYPYDPNFILRNPGLVPNIYDPSIIAAGSLAPNIYDPPLIAAAGLHPRYYYPDYDDCYAFDRWGNCIY